MKTLWAEKVSTILTEATLVKPAQTWMQSGGRSGRHTEHLDRLLAEMQHLQRTFPGQVW
ncbi:MAG: phenylacetate-CoA oxygenase subunit PaaI [Saprospiraceae bacterium]|nr:phenylacetate-CoA oxygenase subunit PaaI [Saprospiraceae bacterium]